MSLSPVAFIAPNYRDYKGWWLKFYSAGTTTPKTIILNSGGTTSSAAKLQLNKDGFITSSGGTIVVPYITGAYDAYLFPTAIEADANNTAQAVRVADGLTNELASSVVVFDNIAEMKAAALNIGQAVMCKRYYADGDLVDGLVYEIQASAAVDGLIDHALSGGNVAILLSSGSISVKQAGAKCDGTFNDRDALQACLSLGGEIKIPSGTLNIGSTLSPTSNSSIIGDGFPTISFTGPSSSYIMDTSSKSNILINGVNFTTPAGTSGFSSLRFVSCENVSIVNCNIDKSGSVAIFLLSCSNCLVDNCNLSNNYTYGIEDRDGTSNNYTNCYFEGNGSTGVASSTGGRGITLWRAKDCKVNNCSFINNNEYGFRIYSEAADVVSSNSNIISNCYFEDNGRLDVYLYDESVGSSLVLNTTISNCRVRRSTIPSLGSSFSISGTNNILQGCSVVKTGTFGVLTAFNLFKGIKCQVSDCYAENLSGFVSFSSASKCIVNDCFADGVAVALSSSTGGGGNMLKGNKFIHGGSGTTDVAVNNFAFTGTDKETYIDNIFDGFHTGIAINEEPVTITGNTTLNSTLGGLRNFGDSFENQEIYNNSWDSTAPALLSGFERKNNPLSRSIVYNTVSPTTLTWRVGDRCINSSPSVGQPKSWVCTVAGTPGTFVSEGNL